MANVPNTGTFSLQDVTIAVHNDAAAGRNLAAAFSGATGIFDAAYAGSKNELEDFRNYMAPFVSGQLVIAMTGSGTYRSIDYGASFSKINTISQGIQGCISGNNTYLLIAQQLYFGARAQKSSDSGLSFAFIPDASIPTSYQCERWTAISADGSYMAICQSEDSVGDGANVLRSINYGVTWQSMLVNGSDGNGWNTVSISGNGQYWYVAQANIASKRSSNYGVSWTDIGLTAYKMDCSMSGQYVVCLWLNGTDSYVLKSENYGVSWTNIYQKTGDGDIINGISISGNGNVIVLTSWWWMAISTNRGASWNLRTVGNGLNTNPGYTESPAISYTGQYIMFEGPSQTDVFRSTDYGASNTKVTIPGSGCYGLFMSKYQI